MFSGIVQVIMSTAVVMALQKVDQLPTPKYLHVLIQILCNIHRATFHAATRPQTRGLLASCAICISDPFSHSVICKQYF